MKQNTTYLTKTFGSVLPTGMCEKIINLFEEEENHKFEGQTSSGVNKSYKASMDLNITGMSEINPEWKKICDHLLEVLFHKTVDYLRDFPFIFNNIENLPQEEIFVREAHQLLSASNMGNPYMQMQRYIDEEGYYAWHAENEGGSSIDRQLFFIYYLNDVDSGGETEFRYSGGKVSPKAGDLLIAPAFWTHLHRGNPPGKGNNKYIITGWIEYTNREPHPEF
jgi:hypothetical protein